MNWSIEQNYILLHFIRCYGESDWFKSVSQLRDLFAVYLTSVNDTDISNFTEDDFRRQYNYILTTTRQECQKQGIKVVKSSELTEVALKKFFNYLEQEQHYKEDCNQLKNDIKLLEEGRIWQIDKDRLRDMREKVFTVVGEDLIGIAFNLGRMEGRISREKREKCLKEMSESWLRRLSDGRLCVAGDTDVFPEELLSQLYEVSGISVPGVHTDTDSDATETLEEGACDNGLWVMKFETAMEHSGIEPSKVLRTKNSAFVKKFSNQKFIPGWKLMDNLDDDNQVQLDEKLKAWEDEYGKSSSNITNYVHAKMSSRAMQLIASRQCLNPALLCHYSPESSTSTQEALNTRLTVSVATESCEMTPGSQSVDTGISHATFDDLDELPASNSVKEPAHKQRKKRSRQTDTGVKRTHNKNILSLNRNAESKKKIMRNITKMVIDHPYSSILLKPLRNDTGIYKQPLLSITKISQDVMNGGFEYYEKFIETIILFFLQMKIYHLNDKETVKKIESVYADISKQLSIIYPDLNDTAPLSDLIQRRQSRFQGHYV